MWILKSYQNPLPNNYSYEQTKGIRHRFPASPIIEELVKAVSDFRIANNLPRASLAECLEDVDRYQCATRNNDGRYCWDCPEPFEKIRQLHRFVSQGCASCGTPVLRVIYQKAKNKLPNGLETANKHYHYE
jgi:hypothetical protein